MSPGAGGPGGPERLEPATVEPVASGTGPEAAPAQQAGAPVRRPGLGRAALRFGVVALLVLLDLWSKDAVFAWLEGSGAAGMVEDEHGHLRRLVLGEGVTWFAFMLSQNKGAAFGSFAEWPQLLVGGRIVASLFLIWLVARSPLRRPWFTLALMLVLAGALGNLYDNIYGLRPEGHPYGAVRDFIDVYFSWIDWHFPTFNVADSCITVGAVLLLLSGLGSEERGASPKAS